MGQLMRDHDWHATVLGPPSQWPQSLRTAVRFILSSGHPMYIWWGPELLCFYNDAYSASIGPERHPSSLGRPGRQVWAEIWEYVGPQIDQVMSGGGPTWNENHLVPITRHGRREEVYWTDSYSPIDDVAAPNQIGGVLVACRETTAAVQAEKRKEAKLSKQREIFRQAPGFVIVMDGPEHRVEFVNDEHRRVFGSEGWIGKTIREALPDIEGQGYLELLDGVYQTRKTYRSSGATLNFRRPSDGQWETRLLDFVYAAILDAEGQATGIFCQGVDVTEQRRAQEVLRANEEQMRLAVEAAEVGLWDVDLIAQSLFWPARVKRMFGISPDQSVSMQDFYDGLHPLDRDATLAAFGAACDPRLRTLYDVEYRTIGKEDGVVRWLAAKGRGVFDEAGVCLRVIGTAIEISSRKAAEGALRESEERLRDSDHRKDEFLAMLAHELRNPLAPIATASALLGQAGDRPEIVSRASQIIDRQVRHMTELVDDLLDVSRVTQGLIQIERNEVEMKGVVHSALEQARPSIEGRGHTLNLRLPESDIWVSGDRTRLVQALVNLLNNAAKYTPSGGSVTVSLETDDQSVLLRVRDNGSGIEARLLPHIFELFVQAERAPDRSQGGLGIGLALVKALVELHGGQVHATSGGDSQGSEFVIGLPTIAAPNSMVPMEKAGRPSVVPKRILVTDDNVDAAQTLASLLELDSHIVHVCYQGSAALQLAATHPFDVCILDLGLPDMTGLELARNLRARPGMQQTVFIAATGYGQDRDKVATSAAGFDHHLVKPIELDTLRALLA
ncbi:MAG: response regulator [Ramlibacter sp.]|nr:response regulator [Ramlibacter sp.]